MSPVPNDIPLPLPAPEPLLIVVLVGFFLLHILFVNLMVGGVLMTLRYQVLGLRDERFDRLAHVIANTITVNKSIAVVLGIGPLLAINTLYTVFFYSANALTGTMWLLLVPLVAAAFLLTYLHKFTWETMANRRLLHIAVITVAAAILLFIPLIFLANITLMLFPTSWTQVRGFIDAMLLPGVLSRYAHFLLASFAVTGLYMVWLVRRMPGDQIITLGFPRDGLIRRFYLWAIVPTLAQFLVGPILLLSLPEAGLSRQAVVTILIGAIVAMPAVVLMWSELRSGPGLAGRRFWPVTALLLVTVVCMASGRHLYRAASLAPHQDAIRIKTEAYQKAVAEARQR